jgi:hypothetical protein
MKTPSPVCGAQVDGDDVDPVELAGSQGVEHAIGPDRVGLVHIKADRERSAVLRQHGGVIDEPRLAAKGPPEGSGDNRVQGRHNRADDAA